MSDMETRFYDVELEAREDGEIGTIEGRPIVYNREANLGYFTETILPGALDRADLTDVRLCMNHDTSYVYARSRRNNPNSTMRLIADANGLQINADLNIKSSPKAQDFYSAVKRGDMDKMSFMFTVAEDEWTDIDTDMPKRFIKSISKVVEVSCVTFPAYESTDIQARSKEALDNARTALESARQQDVDTSDLELAKAKAVFQSKI